MSEIYSRFFIKRSLVKKLQADITLIDKQIVQLLELLTDETSSTISQSDHLNFRVVFSSVTFCIKCKRHEGHLEIKILPSLDLGLF